MQCRMLDLNSRSVACLNIRMKVLAPLLAACASAMVVGATVGEPVGVSSLKRVLVMLVMFKPLNELSDFKNAPLSTAA